MDLYFVKYNFKQEMSKNCYSWQEILFALENKIITIEDVIEYASYILNEDTVAFDKVLEIACLDGDDNIYPYVQALIEYEDTQNPNEVKERWLYFILKWLFEERKYVENAIELVEEIYELFDYPDSITSFVRYLSSESGDLGSLEMNRERLFKNWNNYLERYEEENMFFM